MSDVAKDTEVKPDDAEDTDFEGHRHRPPHANDEASSDESGESEESDFEGHRHRHV